MVRKDTSKRTLVNKKKTMNLLITAGLMLSLVQTPTNVHASMITHHFRSSVRITPRTTSRFRIHRSTPRPRTPSRFKTPSKGIRKAKKYSSKTTAKTPKTKYNANNFSKKTTNKITAKKVLGNHYAKYSQQSIFSNPWMWMFFMNHHHNTNQQQSTDYQKGYRDGIKSAVKEEKTGKSVKKPWAKSKKTYSNDYKDGWERGYLDYKNDGKKIKN